jgi:Flp pilus assembly pilin Flp
MFKLIDHFRRSRSAATSVEYCILATCVALAIVVAVSFVGTQVNATYVTVSSSFQ